jgi:hypothetical protein
VEIFDALSIINNAMTAALTFDADTHTYRYAGRIVPGVTSVLEQLQTLDGVPYAILKAAQEFGTHVHLACHLHNIGQLDEETLDPALRPYLADWKAFLADSHFVVTSSEERVYHAALGYAGTADVFGLWQRSYWVLDIKSGVVPSTVGAQLAAYQHAKNPFPRRRACVQLTGKGYKLLEQRELSDFALFQSALNIFKFRSKKRKAVHVDEYA